MKLFVLFALLCYAHRGHGQTPHQLSKRHSSFNESAIVGGYDVIINKFPFAVILMAFYPGGVQKLCGAILISIKFVLSAGHCFALDPFAMIIRVGTAEFDGGKLYHIVHYVKHDNYVYPKIDYDIGLGLTKENVVLDRVAVRIAVLADSSTKVPKYSKLTVLGWGKTNPNLNKQSNKLQAMVVPVIDQDRCVALYSYAMFITDRSFCAGSIPGVKGTCDGDSGSAAVNSKGQVVGIVSGSVGCAVRGYPSYFTRISSFRSWIRTHAGV